ncbi:UNVERIFIED_CONTAM: hypothetical protein K2H54_003639 [Gekko kuhli]
MSQEEGHNAPVTSAEQAPVTMAIVLVSTTPPVPGQSGAIGVAAGHDWVTGRLKVCQDYLLPEGEEEEDDVELRLDTLKRAQGKFHQDLEEVIRAILDMVVRALRAERDARLALDQGDLQRDPRNQHDQPGEASTRPNSSQLAPCPGP